LKHRRYDVEKNTHTGKRIKVLIEKTGMSISEFSEKAHIERAYLQKLFNKEVVGIKMLERIANVLGVTVAEILQGKNSYNQIVESIQQVKEGKVVYDEKYVEQLIKTIEILSSQVQELKEDKRRLSDIIDKHFNIQRKAN
jgi:transcriptional regulator with XRE-family HTH domain